MTDTTESSCPFGFGTATDAKPGAYTHSVVTPALSREKMPRLSPVPIAAHVDGKQTGRCLCGKVSFSFDKPVERILANHDAALRRWTGGVALTIMARAVNMTFSGWGSLVQYAATDREVLCFCRLCGSSVFARHLQPEAMDGMLSISAGALDSLDGLTLAGETHVDQKPEAYDFAGERRKMTTADVDAMYQPKPSVAAE
ncbi:MAG: hypothetical protein ABI459_11470 [Deltaproteobacteria bacterium]